MTRPTYEKDSDEKAERGIAELIERRYNLQSIKFPKYAGMDWLFFRGREPMFFAEIKNRTNPKSTYSTYMISTKKIDCAAELARITKVRSCLIVHWACGAKGGIDLVAVEPERIGMGGRKDRSDSKDIELCAYFKVSDFGPIQEK